MAVPDGNIGRAFSEVQQDLSNGLLGFKKPADFLINLIYCIPALAPIRICLELGIFRRLRKASETNEGDVSAEALAEEMPWSLAPGLDRNTAALPRRDYIVRILRLVCSVGLIDEGEKSFTYRANALTRELADPGMAAGFLMVFDMVMGPKSTISSMLSYSEQNSFRNPETAEDGPFQRAHDIVGTSTFDHFVQKDPLQLSRLNAFMSRVQSDRPHWTEWFPRDRLLLPDTTMNPDGVFMVDVGGGLGHDLFALAAKYPEQELRFVLQDLPSVVDEGTAQRAARGKALDSRISLSTHDFFLPQPIQGSSIYFMHKIMHDWPDADCVRILSCLRDAMGPNSRIFVNDVIVPDKGALLLQAAFDITMLALHSGQERNEEMWRRLVAQVGGLSIQTFHHPPGGEGEGIIEIVSAP